MSIHTDNLSWYTHVSGRFEIWSGHMMKISCHVTQRIYQEIMQIRGSSTFSSFLFKKGRRVGTENISDSVSCEGRKKSHMIMKNANNTDLHFFLDANVFQ